MSMKKSFPPGLRSDLDLWIFPPFEIGEHVQQQGALLYL